MIYSLRCCDPCEITSQKFYTYVCTYVCASVCPALKSPPFFQSFFAHHSIIPLLFLSLFSESSSNRSDRMIDGLSLSLSITLSIYLSFSLSRVRPSGACVNVLTPCSSLELFISLGSKRGLIITIPKNFYLNFFPQDLYILLHNYFPTFHPFQYIILDRIVQSVYLLSIYSQYILSNLTLFSSISLSLFQSNFLPLISHHF